MAMNIDVPSIAKYEHVVTVRRSDGMRIAATRKVIDTQTPIRWQISVWDKDNHLVYQELPLFEEGNTPFLYRTSDLLQQAKKRGFEDWYHLPIAYVEAWHWNDLGDETKKYLIPKYSLFDPTDYPVD